ncbi:hypothetical protein CDAR_69211 [Caerostris darwini]|uniref:Uncharacterized protein n=1 Tax=Caerostris darwini TaxID=1538125 RepID=A0AAV4U0M7_9ARAC|nr:hypothetical protein CDAR_69211 [Caerostris darwini]
MVVNKRETLLIFYKKKFFLVAKSSESGIIPKNGLSSSFFEIARCYGSPQLNSHLSHQPKEMESVLNTRCLFVPFCWHHLQMFPFWRVEWFFVNGDLRE